MPGTGEASRPDICEAESVHHALFFAETFGTKLHVFHMSSKQAAYMVRDAKARGLRVLRKPDRTTCCASPTIWIKSALC